MKGINKVIIIGTLGQDPETRYFQDGNAVTNCSVATSEHWKDKTTGEKKEATEWHKVSFRGRLAEVAGEYLSKGSKIYIEGKLKTRKWQDQEGNDRYITEIQAYELQMLGGGESLTNAGITQVKNSLTQGIQPQQEYKKAKESYQPEMTQGFSDDIPF